jgi:hypothetical protein
LVGFQTSPYIHLLSKDMGNNAKCNFVNSNGDGDLIM